MDTATIEVRKLTIDDYQQLKDSMIQAYASLGGQYWKEVFVEAMQYMGNHAYPIEAAAIDKAKLQHKK